MRSTILQFERFILDQDQKITKATKAIEQERKLINSSNVSLMGLLSNLHGLLQISQNLSNQVCLLSRYRKFLMSVSDLMGNDSDPLFLLKRYALLSAERADLEKKVATTAALLEVKYIYLVVLVFHVVRQAEYNTMKKAKTNELLIKNSQMAMSTKFLEEVSDKTADIENETRTKEMKYISAVCQFCMCVCNC